jgi:hypothetical protein
VVINDEATEATVTGNDVLAAALDEVETAEQRRLAMDAARIAGCQDILDERGSELLAAAYIVLSGRVSAALFPLLQLADVHWFYGWDDSEVPLPDDSGAWNQEMVSKIMSLDAALIAKDGTGIARVYYRKASRDGVHRREPVQSAVFEVTDADDQKIDSLAEYILRIYAAKAEAAKSHLHLWPRRRREAATEVTMISSIAVNDVRSQLRDLRARMAASGLSSDCKSAVEELFRLVAKMLAAHTATGTAGTDSNSHYLVALGNFLDTSLKLHQSGPDFDREFIAQVTSIRLRLEQDPASGNVDALSASQIHTRFLESFLS